MCAEYFLQSCGNGTVIYFHQCAFFTEYIKSEPLIIRSCVTCDSPYLPAIQLTSRRFPLSFLDTLGCLEPWFYIIRGPFISTVQYSLISLCNKERSFSVTMAQ